MLFQPDLKFGKRFLKYVWEVGFILFALIRISYDVALFILFEENIWWFFYQMMISDNFAEFFYTRESMIDLNYEKFLVFNQIKFPFELVQFLSCCLFWKSWPTKFIPLTDNEKLKTDLLSILIYLLNHKLCEAMVPGKKGRDKKYFPYFITISW